MTARIVILGGGVGGTLAANLLARHLHGDDAEIVVADRTGQHVYQPGWLYIPFGREEPDNLVRDERGLLNRHVRLVRKDFLHIDPERRRLVAADGDTLDYDFLIIATGSRNVPDAVPGLAEANHHFYSAEAALALGEALKEFDTGRIIVGIGGLPYRCPPAPVEFLFLLDDLLRKQGKRDRVELLYTYPIGRVFTIEPVADFLVPLFAERGIVTETFFNLETVDPAAKQITSLEGTTLDYDLLIMVPPHAGAAIVGASGLGDEQGWVPTERHTLEVQGQERMYAIGDATNLPVSKSGSAAHFQAKVVADRITAEVTGKPSDDGHYNGHVLCFIETGKEQATTINFDYDHPPTPPHPSRIYHYEKMVFNRAYWHIVPTGIL